MAQSKSFQKYYQVVDCEDEVEIKYFEAYSDAIAWADSLGLEDYEVWTDNGDCIFWSLED